MKKRYIYFVQSMRERLVYTWA